MRESRPSKKSPDPEEENDQGPDSQSDSPDERLRDFLQGRFPEKLPPSQSPKEETPDNTEKRKTKKRGKKPLPVQKQLPKPKEE